MKHYPTKGSKKFSYSLPNPKLEDCPINKDMSFTINAKEEFPIISANVMHYMYMIKKYIIPYMEVKYLYPELSPKGRLHYHGTVQFKDYQQVFDWYYSHHKIEGLMLSLDTIGDDDKWDKYITKQHKYLYKIIKPYRLTPRVIKKLVPKPQTIREQFQFNIDII